MFAKILLCNMGKMTNSALYLLVFCFKEPLELILWLKQQHSRILTQFPQWLLQWANPTPSS